MCPSPWDISSQFELFNAGISRGKDMSNILGVSDEEEKEKKKSLKKRRPRLTELDDTEEDDDTDDYHVSLLVSYLSIDTR